MCLHLHLDNIFLIAIIKKYNIVLSDVGRWKIVMFIELDKVDIKRKTFSPDV